jgi:hypothetical protein
MWKKVSSSNDRYITELTGDLDEAHLCKAGA